MTWNEGNAQRLMPDAYLYLMFRLQNPDYLYLAALAPLLLAVFVYYWRGRRRALERFADRAMIPRLAPGVNKRLPWTKVALIVLAVPLLAMAAANPQWAAQREEIKRRGIDVIIGLDVSNSMMAEDVKPSRMERAKFFATELVDELVGNNLGVELFTCTALMQAPLTTDYAFIKTVVNSAAPYQISAQGTNLGQAIETAEAAFDEKSANHRALILISDGEDHDGNARNAASRAHDEGLLIYTVGVGKSGSHLMPYLDANGIRRTINDAGRPVTTTADMETLRDVAEAGGGKYYPLSGDSGALAAAIKTTVDRIEKQEFEAQTHSTYDSYFHYFLLPALLLLGLEFYLGRRDARKARRDAV